MTKRESSVDDRRGPAPAASVSHHPGRLDIAVLGGMLVESKLAADHLEVTLFGRLDSESVQMLEAALPEAPGLLDLTHLDFAQPEALRSLTGRQRQECHAGRELLLRIAPHQASQLAQLGA